MWRGQGTKDKGQGRGVYKGWVEEVKGQWVHGEGKGTREGMEGAWGIQVRDKGQGVHGMCMYLWVGDGCGRGMGQWIRWGQGVHAWEVMVS